MVVRRVSWVFAVFFGLLPASAAQAQTAPQITPQTSALQREPVRLSLLDAGGERAGLLIRLAPGWKFYWRTPGEGGLPPRFDWSASRNLAHAEVKWPAPQRINIGNTELYGYTGEVVLPIKLVPQQKGQPLDLDLALEYGVCKEICILREDRLTHRLSHGMNAPADIQSSAAVLVARWQAKVPQPAEQAGIRLVSRHSTPGELGITLESDLPLSQPDLFIEGPSEAWFSRPEVSLSPDRRQARFVFSVSPVDAAAKPLTLTLVDDAIRAEMALKP
ncbi:protein-disulfide reductase DsbD domain-containing protein [uncultured Ferrovibrio sp.]|jgi:Uncharacterized protein predicted to be involved in C-type cytochrome biogenesis|uniref:protein-disulfide reductase DsbD domain-containing protein n=1 Tax=uncultured Ferrovibrio sp. TaxID=1576913 RepID=UPI002614D10D|nr:protein-disulfide reductase DsbD domain-containing protein [uncultured Ferrovibrio sp.]